MTDADTARRERALASVDEVPLDADMDWADAQETRSDYGLGFLIGYLAGSREEAAEMQLVLNNQDLAIIERERQLNAKDAEIETLRTTYDSLALHCTQREALLQSLIALRNEQTTKIAALREAVRNMVSLYIPEHQDVEDGIEYEPCESDCPTCALLSSPAVRRALEGEP